MVLHYDKEPGTQKGRGLVCGGLHSRVLHRRPWPSPQPPAHCLPPPSICTPASNSPSPLASRPQPPPLSPPWLLLIPSASLPLPSLCLAWPPPNSRSGLEASAHQQVWMGCACGWAPHSLPLQLSCEPQASGGGGLLFPLHTHIQPFSLGTLDSWALSECMSE